MISDGLKRFLPFISLIALCALIPLGEYFLLEKNPVFLTPGNLAAIARQTAVITIMAMLMNQATMLKLSEFTYSPIKSRRFTSNKMKISTTGNHTPLPTCEKIKIFHNGALGSRTMPAPTAIKIVYSQ